MSSNYKFDSAHALKLTLICIFTGMLQRSFAIKFLTAQVYGNVIMRVEYVLSSVS